jgi:uncharacterized membrane protein YeaQ/YmgE (transglycosylase-associated protein family)
VGILKPKKRSNRLFLYIALGVIGFLIFGGILNAVSPVADKTPTAKPEPAKVNTIVPETKAPTLVAAKSTRCIAASAGQFANIQDGIKGKQATNSIKTAWAVKSNDFSNVYMVAARIYGPGMEGKEPIGVWAINGDPASPGLTLSVDSFAKQFTSYPDASKTQAAITQSADGVSEVKTCAENNK